MQAKSFLKNIHFSLSPDQTKDIQSKVKIFLDLLKKSLASGKIKADVFVGGSYAKNTMVVAEEYDIDIFVRFAASEGLADTLEKALSDKEIKKRWKVERVHGSRDYFRIFQGNLIFEVIPVKKIASPRDMENVTDLSYFHVNYVRKKLKKNLGKEVALAKMFSKSAGVYGAESYINGFSGYGLECLIIHYKSFDNMLKALVKVKGQLILDPEKHFKKKEHILVELNQSKLQSPIVLVDPTWKSRNVLAALNAESFFKFQQAAKAFLAKPSDKFFQLTKVDEQSLKEEAKKKKASFVRVRIETGRQEGDIAGTKLKKFADFIVREADSSFEIIKKEFSYAGGQDADFYIIAEPRNALVKKGPPANLKKHVAAFKKAHKKTFVKDGWLFANITSESNLKKFIQTYAKNMSYKIKEMDITKLEAY